MESKVHYDVTSDENARDDWYLSNRDLFIAERVSSLAKPGSKVLDAGCGPGVLAALLSSFQLDVSGIDADEASVSLARSSGRVRDAQVADICNLPFPDNSFDLVVSSEVLEHVEDDVAALKELRRVSRGPIVITVPAHPCLWTESDTVLLHFRRYRRRDIYDLAHHAGVKKPELHAFCLIPALGVLAFKCVSAIRGKKKESNAKPLALQFKLPSVLNSVLKAVFRFEMLLSRYGLIPWGHGWWMVIRD